LVLGASFPQFFRDVAIFNFAEPFFSLIHLALYYIYCFENRFLELPRAFF